MNFRRGIRPKSHNPVVMCDWLIGCPKKVIGSVGYNRIHIPFISRWNHPLILTIDPNFLGHPSGGNIYPTRASVFCTRAMVAHLRLGRLAKSCTSWPRSWSEALPPVWTAACLCRCAARRVAQRATRTRQLGGGTTPGQWAHLLLLLLFLPLALANSDMMSFCVIRVPGWGSRRVLSLLDGRASSSVGLSSRLRS